METTMKKAIELETCKEGKTVILIFRNKEDYTGKFKRFDGNKIILQSITTNNIIGLPFDKLDYYLEKI
jgi:hypothetical protein